MLRRPKYRTDIQALRGLAVLAIVLFHAKENFAPLGYLGVDVFFVISGFVVTPLMLRIFDENADEKNNRMSNLRHFYLRRYYRLAPALATTLVLSAILVFTLGPANDHLRFAYQGIATLFVAGNFGAYRYSGDYFNSNFNPLLHTWSLSVEEQIYILLPFLLFLILRKRLNIIRTISIVFILITSISFILFLFPSIMQPIYNLIETNYLSSGFSFYSPIERIWQFTLGGIGYLLLKRRNYQIKKYSILINLLLIAALLFFLFGKSELELKNNSIIASMVTLFIILFQSLEILPKYLMKKLCWIGDRSYSIYLVHLPLLYIAKYSQVAGYGSGENRVIQTTIAVLASFFFGSMSYSKIENKFRNIGKNKTTSFKNMALAFILSWLIPLTLFASIASAVENNYWGFIKNSFRPPTALDSLTGCVEDLTNKKICSNPNFGATKSVLLIGDSHAGHISLALRDSANIVNWNSVYIESSKIENLGNRTDDRTISWILKNRPDLVIVSQYWQENSPQGTIKKEFLNLKKLVNNVLVVENNPIWPDISRFNLSGFLLSPYDLPRTFKKSEMRTVEKNSSDDLAKWARNNGISTMNFEDLFCSRTRCSRYLDNNWLYTDYNHLSAAGANLTVPQLSKFLTKISKKV
jgi:peptidoglycan/LPS O-acetylase OafA/YrhL